MELHQSDISAFLGCAKQWAYKRRMPRMSSEAQYLGTRFHRAVGAYLELRADGLDVGPEEIVAGLRASWGITENGETVQWETDPAGVLALAESLVRDYLAWAAFQPGLEPAIIDGKLAIERLMTLDLGHCTLVGTLDVQTKKGEIIDWKTAATQDHAIKESQTMIQPWVYTLLKAGGDIAKAVTIPFIYHFAIKKKTAIRIFPVVVYVRRVDLEMLVYDLIPDIIQRIKYGLFGPNSLYEYCSSKFCPVWSQCRGDQTAYQQQARSGLCTIQPTNQPLNQSI